MNTLTKRHGIIISAALVWGLIIGYAIGKWTTLKACYLGEALHVASSTIYSSEQNRKALKSLYTNDVVSAIKTIEQQLYFNDLIGLGNENRIIASLKSGDGYSSEEIKIKEFYLAHPALIAQEPEHLAILQKVMRDVPTSTPP